MIDLHAHPSMKTYFGGARLGRRYTPGRALDIKRLRTNYPSLVNGGVDVLLSSVYVPERDLARDCWVIALGGLLIGRLREAFRTRPDEIAIRMMRHVEEQVAAVNAERPGRRLTVARSFAQLERARGAGDLVFVHTLEGGHVLNGSADNVHRFRDLGVASITLAHFYPNGIAPPVESIPDDVFLRKLGCFRFEEDVALGLTALGTRVVEEMLEHGVIVDLTHCTPRARADVFAIPNPKRRPIVMTHVGAHAVRPVPMNPTDQEIRTIADTGGVVGVIFYNYWLAEDYRSSDTLRHLLPHVRHLVNTGGEDCVAFGSDFDGLTDPPDDLRQPADWPNLRAALEREGYTASQVEKFTGGNAWRVLREGWGA